MVADFGARGISGKVSIAKKPICKNSAISVCVCVCLSLCACMCVCVCVCVYIYIYIYECVCSYIKAFMQSVIYMRVY